MPLLAPFKPPAAPVTARPVTPGRAFLLRFPSRERSCIGDLFHRAVRAGCQEPAGITAHVREEALRRSRARDVPAGMRRTCASLVRTLDALPAEALAYAEHVRLWQTLTPEQRAAVRCAREATHRRADLAGQEPTAGQLQALRALEYSGPVPASALDASELLTRLRQEGGLE